jgi:hypothetical protein
MTSSVMGNYHPKINSTMTNIHDENQLNTHNPSKIDLKENQKIRAK